MNCPSINFCLEASYCSQRTISSCIKTSSLLNSSHSRYWLARAPTDPATVVKATVIAADKPGLPPIARDYATAIELPAATPAPCKPAKKPPATGPAEANPMECKVSGKAKIPTPIAVAATAPKMIVHLLAYIFSEIKSVKFCFFLSKGQVFPFTIQTKEFS